MPGSPVKSAARVAEILELFAEERRPLSATQISKTLSYPKSSANLLLHTLVECGWLSLNTESMLFFPTLRVAALGDWLPSALFGGDSTEALVKELWEKSQETSTLSIPNGVRMEFVRVHVGTFPISLNLPEGTHVPMFGTAVGTAYLQTHPDDAVERLYSRAEAESALTDPDRNFSDYLTEIRQARRRGYAVGYDRLLSDTGALGVCVFAGGPGNTVVMGAGGLSSRIANSEVRISKLMRQLAARAQKQATAGWRRSELRSR
ncbi:IclR family transcriptional regulator [Congregibacter sp.]|uniref:IclR family transcriptional regulator n=1 Tax=Congregibacter sp. TaxID=2744308 RepID=UPI0039E2FE69